MKYQLPCPILSMILMVCVVSPLAMGQEVSFEIQDSPPQPSKAEVRHVVTELSLSAVLLEEVPTSTWTYGCTATAAGMLLGYYDRHDYPDMYAGPTNGGIAPLVNLGQGDDPANPIAGSCSLIATQDGFDGRDTPGHVDDYWVSLDSIGPDPWEAGGFEHPWDDCIADYMGTNQWKWDAGSRQYNADGATIYWYRSDGSPLHDFLPSPAYGLPQTACCHGLKLFAEARGYNVVTNFNQLVDSQGQEYGFTFLQYMAEINAGRPVLIHVTGHTMLGVGYDAMDQKVYLHDTWDNDLHFMTWGGTYDSREMKAVTVFELENPYCGGNGFSYGDVDRDCDVDLEDFAILQSCYLSTQPVCVDAFDSDNNNIIDDSDYTHFEAFLGGPEQTPRSETLLFDLGYGVQMMFVRIPSGSFQMGDTTLAGESTERPAHVVNFSSDVYMAVTEVTQVQWEIVMGTTPWSGQPGVMNGCMYCAASWITWDDANAFCDALSGLHAEEFRLPTEAEWEYACRAGSATQYSFGDEIADLFEYAWFDLNADYAGNSYSHPVAQKQANPWGLYDMHGNVWEWCQDWYGPGYYAVCGNPADDPQGPTTGIFRVVRGGSWDFTSWHCRSAARRAYSPSLRSHFGFRPVVVLER